LQKERFPEFLRIHQELFLGFKWGMHAIVAQNFPFDMLEYENCSSLGAKLRPRNFRWESMDMILSAWSLSEFMKLIS
jgi:hypothetical protein